jgi:MYXO-CTERM domain-containing protein
MNARLLAVSVSLFAASCGTGAVDELGRSTAGLKGGVVDTTATSVVGVVNTKPTFSSICTGSLIAPNLVLVARSCVSDLAGGGGTTCATSLFTAPGGSLDVYFDATITQDAGAHVHVDKTIVPSDDHVCGNDLALLVLSSNIPSSVATPIVPRLDVAPTKGETYTAVGYGAIDETGAETGVRRHLTSLAVACVTGCPEVTAEGKEIVGAAGPCNGDNGSPAIDTAGKVFAISSRGPGACAAGLYTRLDAAAAFLKAGALEAATKGGYTAPAWATSPGDAGTDATTSDASPDAPMSDAPVSDTAGTDAATDAAATGDAMGVPAPAAEESSGCGCATVGTTASSPYAIAGLLLAALVRRRKRDL